METDRARVRSVVQVNVRFKSLPMYLISFKTFLCFKKNSLENFSKLENKENNEFLSRHKIMVWSVFDEVVFPNGHFSFMVVIHVLENIIILSLRFMMFSEISTIWLAEHCMALQSGVNETLWASCGG